MAIYRELSTNDLILVSVSDEHNPERPFCDCEDWEVCGCGNQPPYHCPWCCRDLSPERLASWNWETWRRKPQ